MDLKQTGDYRFGTGVRVGPLEMEHLGCDASEHEPYSTGFWILRIFCFTRDQS